MYGLNNFEFKIIEECREELLNEREIYWIEFYKSYDLRFGYNLTHGGEGGKPNQEVCKLRSQRMLGQGNPNYGKHHSSETIQKISESRKGIVAWNKGMRPTEEVKEKLSIAHKGRKLPEDRRQKRYAIERSKGVRKDSKSGYRGVHYCKERNKWIAKIHCDGKHINLGRYDTPEQAAEAYNKAASFYFGEFAYLNELPQAN